MLLFPAVNAASAQAAGPEWKLTVTPDATYFTPGPADQQAYYTIEAENVGTAPTNESQPIVLEDTPPAGLTPVGIHFYSSVLGFFNHTPFQESEGGLSLSEHGYCPTDVRCELPAAGGVLAPGEAVVPPGERLIMQVRVEVPQGAAGPLVDSATVSGGAAATAVQATATNEASARPPFGIRDFTAPLTDSSKTAPYTQAGGHPYQLVTEFDLATRTNGDEAENHWGLYGISPVRDPRDIDAELPPGLIGNPQAVPTCSLATFFASECPLSTVVGTVGTRDSTRAQGAIKTMTALYNLQPAGAYPGELGYQIGFPFLLSAGLRSSGDYGLTIASAGIPEVGLQRVRVVTWGVPADPSHDVFRGKNCAGRLETGAPAWARIFTQSIAQVERDCEADTTGGHGGEAGVPPTPFLTMPTECSGAPLSFGLRSDPWQEPGNFVSASTTDPAVSGCNALHFEPTIEARPTTTLADSPSGFDFTLKVPQDLDAEGLEDPNGLATPELKEAVVALPPGLVVNPSSANGLLACSPAQVGLTTPVGTTPAHFTETPAQCPDASKLGTVEVDTQLLHNPLKGSVYLATPHQNPSGNLLAGYIVLEGEGVIIKLAGQFRTDPQSGRITASFLENPQTPFKEFRFHFFEGAQGALRTPATCGTYQVGSTLTPYSFPESGPAATPTASFQTSEGPTGGPCPASLPNSPTFTAGTESPVAGIYSPFSLRLVRRDGEQELKGIETTLPEGLVGRLAGVAECPDAAIAAAAQKSGAAEQASPSCPQGSEVGTVDVASGAGPTPIHVPGKVYLAGPYKGAPLSLAIVTPALAGPFDLGTVVVRTALQVAPLTTQITAVSDPIPTILEGIPLDVRSITLQMKRPDFTLNPTSCEPKAITGSVLSVFDKTASLNQRFQVGGCSSLAFKPGLKISLKGSTKHAGHPALEAVVTYPSKGTYSNIASAQVNLPHSEFIDQANLDKTCTRPVLLEGKCPARSIYGKAKAWTPLLDKPLEGPVYLVGGFGYKLPALVAELDGQIRVLLVGKVDSGPNKGIRNTFETVPDAPVSRFVLQMKGGKKYSLLENSEDLCRRPQKAIASFTAQSGKTLTLNPTISNGCGKHGKKKGHGKKGKGAKGGKGAGHGAAQDLIERLGGW